MGRSINYLAIGLCLFLILSYQNCSVVDPGFKLNNNLDLDSNEPRGNGPRSTPTPVPRNDTELRDFFRNNVEAAFEASCIGCHNEPRFGGTATLSIYNYDAMKAKISDGVGPANNQLFNKMRNVIAHDGGDRCRSGSDQSPCKEVIDWWQEEFGQSNQPIAASAVTSLTDLGRVIGYASDSNDGARILEVTFFIDGPAGTGINVGSMMANLTGPVGDRFEGHYFDFTLPDQYRDGNQHTLYVYAGGTNAADQVGVERAYTAYKLGQAGDPGFDYYMSDVRPRLQTSCGGCHNINYQEHFVGLLTPSPAKGGTSTVNKLIDKAAGMDAHGGGNRCGNKNSSPCSELTTWWNMEFN